VNDLEAALADAKVRRDKISVDIRKASDAAFAGDKRQLFALTGKGGLNQQEAAAGRLILSIEKRLGEARKHVRMAEAQAAAAAEAKAGLATDNGAARRLVQLEIRAPDGRVLRQWHKLSVMTRRSRLWPVPSVRCRSRPTACG
jgi:hypothetical protein